MTDFLDEKKASLGDPSEIADPVTPRGGSNHHRGADKTGGEREPIRQGNSPMTRAAMMSDVMNAMRGVDTDELKGIHKIVTGDGRNGPGEPVILQGNSKLRETLAHVLDLLPEDHGLDEDELEAIADYVEYGGEMATTVEPVRITAADVDTSAISELFGESGLSDEATDKIKTIFEATVVDRVNDMVGEISRVSENEMDAIEESMRDHVGQYLDYVTEQWLEANEVAIEANVRTRLAESFLARLGDLFTEHYVDVPEDRVDIAEALVEENRELEESVSQMIEENVGLINEVEQLRRASVVQNAVKDMTVPEAEKLAEIAEGIAFEDSDTFERKVKTIRETYFSERDDSDLPPIPTIVEDGDMDGSEIVLTEDAAIMDSGVNRYLNNLRRTAGRA